MTPKERRDRLFRGGRPFVRPFNLYENGQYSKDMGILWVAHQNKPFWDFPEDKEEFLFFVENLSERASLYMVEDKNPEYSERGPVAFVWVFNDDWQIEPHTEFFPWASKRNILRSTVSFLHMSRLSKAIGIIIVYSKRVSVPLFDKCKEYGVLRYVGKIYDGYRDSDKYIYSSRGKQHVRKHTESGRG